MVDNNVIYHGNNQNHYPKFHHEQMIQIVPPVKFLIVGGNNTCFIVPGSSALSIEVIDDDLVLGTGCK